MKSLKILALTGLLALTGCASVNQGVPSAALEAKLTSSNKANVLVGEKVTASSEGTVVLGFMNFMYDDKFADGVQYSGDGALSFMDTSGKLKSAAAYKAMEKSGADVLVAPTYITQVNNYVLYKKIKVTVSAYKGKITSIK